MFYKKFKLKPKQKAPIGSLSEGLPCGCVLFAGKEIPDDIDFYKLTLDELKAFKLKQVRGAFFIGYIEKFGGDLFADFVFDFSETKDISKLEAFIKEHSDEIKKATELIKKINNAKAIEDIIDVKP